jgi:hypothetical protein
MMERKARRVRSFKEGRCMMRSKRWTMMALCGAILSLLLVGTPSGAAAPGAPGQLAVAYRLDPAQPVAGQPTAITATISAVGGPLTIALVRSFSINAVSDASGLTISAAAVALSAGPGGSYTAALTFPSAGLWHIATESFQNAQGNAFDVVVADAPPPDPPTCRAADLGADAQWQGAAGSRIGTMTVTNNGTGACSLIAYPAVDIVDTQGQLVPTATGAFTDATDAGGALVLQPGQQAASDVRWSNRCPQANASDTFSLRVTLPGNDGSFAVPASVPPCLGDTQPSHLGQQPFTLRGDAAQVVRDYYMAINNRTYPQAYALFGAQMQQNQSADDFAAGFATTQQDDLHIRAITRSGDQSVIAIALMARETNGAAQRYTGSYTIGPENGTLKIIVASIALV